MTSPAQVFGDLYWKPLTIGKILKYNLSYVQIALLLRIIYELYLRFC